MKFTEALGFFSIGLVVLALPQVAPELCPRNGFDGSSGRELWLDVMGILLAAVGGAGLAWNAAVGLLAAFEAWRATGAEVRRENEAEMEAQWAWVGAGPRPARERLAGLRAARSGGRCERRSALNTLRIAER